MTITTSKQLAEALGGGKWLPRSSTGAEVAHADLDAMVWDVPGEWVAFARDHKVRAPSPRAAVLALADRLEAEARALRESVK